MNFDQSEKKFNVIPSRAQLPIFPSLNIVFTCTTKEAGQLPNNTRPSFCFFSSWTSGQLGEIFFPSASLHPSKINLSQNVTFHHWEGFCRSSDWPPAEGAVIPKKGTLFPKRDLFLFRCQISTISHSFYSIPYSHNEKIG